MLVKRIWTIQRDLELCKNKLQRSIDMNGDSAQIKEELERIKHIDEFIIWINKAF